MMTLWAPKWSQTNELDGHREHLMIWHRHGIGGTYPTIFATRRECRAYIESEYGYIRGREDLRREPHCWRVPQAVRVQLTEVIHP
jgi:hypothetical protein